MAEPVGLALGTNLGDRIGHLREAVRCIGEWSTEDLLLSSVWETEPVGCPEGSAAFFNAVVEVWLDLEPRDLLSRTQALERERGRLARDKRAPNAPRPLDVDILYFGRRRIATEDLVIPHPRLTSRRFVLDPLCEIRPDLVLPGEERTVRELRDRLRSGEAAPARIAETLSG